jgi:alkylhydroperoxidase family enzyme
MPGPYIRLIEEHEAEGPLAEEYDAAIERAGKVFNILKAMSLRPAVLRASMALYREIMFGESGLSRKERELLATVASAEQSCHY